MTEDKRIRTTVVFDLDGTLLDTLVDLTGSVNFALKKNGYPLRSVQEVRGFLGNGIRYLMHCAVPENLTEEAFENTFLDFRGHYLIHCMDTTHPYAGVTSLLKSLKTAGYKLAIVSNKLQPAVEELNGHFFNGIVDVAIGESRKVHRKPAPDTVIKALEILGSTPGETVYVGDSEVDILTAEHAGLPCVSVLWGFRDKDFLLAHHARITADKPADILALLQEPL